MKLNGIGIKMADFTNDNQNKAKILVVEDVANVATVLAARLESYGYEVCGVANTGKEAVDGASLHQPDLILMDIMLEGDMNGVEAAEQITKNVDIPIIYLSCLNDEAVVLRAIKTYTYGYIVKPYDKAELLFGIENALSKHRDVQMREMRIAELESQCKDANK